MLFRSPARLLLQCADDGVGRVSRDDLGVVEHVELLRRVAAGIEKDGLLTSRVVGKEARHVEDLAVDDDPAVILLVVLVHLLDGESLLS